MKRDKMGKVIVFDLDGTLASLGKGIQYNDLKVLKQFEKAGYQIAVCSGKPTYYLCGFMRQAELENPILIGENGANIQFGVDLPPEKYYLYPYSREAKEQIAYLKPLIEDMCGDQVWFQPNVAGLTPFPKNEAVFEQIARLIEEKRENLTDVLIYRHIDSFDITPKEINKQNGLKYLAELTGIGNEDMIAVGDGINDIPMFEYAGYSIGIGQKMSPYVDICFDSISDALTYLSKLI